MVLRRSGTSILVATEGGYGKRSGTDQYRVSHRGGKGIITVKTTNKTGKMVAIREVVNTDDVVVVTNNGIIIRQHASEIRLAGRNTQGVRLIRLEQGDSISDVTAVASEEEEAEEKGEGAEDLAGGNSDVSEGKRKQQTSAKAAPTPSIPPDQKNAAGPKKGGKRRKK